LALQSAFPAPTNLLPTTYNPSELIARGAAIQASLISSYDAQTISEAIHPIVTLVGHTIHPIGVKLANGQLDVVLEGDTAVPCRGKRIYKSNEGGDVTLEIFEGRRETEVVQTPLTPPPEEDGEEEEREEVKQRIVVPEKRVALLRLKGVKVGGEIEVQVQIDSEGKATIVGREIRRKDGSVTKGVVEAEKAE
jgi:molecular chaperone DnaK (HSP70)